MRRAVQCGRQARYLLDLEDEALGHEAGANKTNAHRVACLGAALQSSVDDVSPAAAAAAAAQHS
jgi:hypothetical protein